MPWAKPWKDLNGNGFNIPDIGKVVTVVFESGNEYKPEYIYSDHFNVNLEKKLLELGLKNFHYYPYDPVFPEYGPPKKADIVCCIDVLEHVEEEFLTNVLDELKKITMKIGFFTIATKPAGKFLKESLIFLTW